jgi:homocysteine S-methyltransferase
MAGRFSPAYDMINCAHPIHVAAAFAGNSAWAWRIRGLKANASTLSHAELEAMTTLEAGDAGDLAERYVGLTRMLAGLAVLGGCCGIDHTHVAAIAGRCSHHVAAQ